ncbi:hypothetical protein Ddye_028538 [Dipteronia dyeriana]|uniref:DUF4283 domain-containing protein n=1 Tax=Dipteronia dyeriana TaxID=168575 RepID=A0AAD9TD34_9ROSI|nr:hypothetical protein Ddye_028538 [Dipteronia dyeriana]
MKLSPKLKEQLHKLWSNALILKNMGRSHTLNFMFTKLNQKWNLIGQCQLTDLGEGYFVVRFQMKEDMDYVLTEGPWVITNQCLAIQRWKPNFVPREDSIQNMKNYGNGKTTGSSTDTNFGKTTKVMNTDVAKKVNVSKASGFRFDILSEEVDVTMKENKGQFNMSSDENVECGSKTKDLGILSKITNLSEEHRNQAIKKGCNSLSQTQKNKKGINKKVVKPFEKRGQLNKIVVSQKDDSCTLRTTGSKGKKQSLKSVIIDNEDGITR